MLDRELFVRISLIMCLFSCSRAVAVCPSADMSGDCFVNYEDFALLSGHWLNAFDCNDLIEMAGQWLTEGIPPDPPGDMVYIPGGEFEMGNHFDPEEGWDDELPVHAVLLDAFFMSRFEITNSQYCDFLNSAYPDQVKVVDDVVYASSDSSNSYPYCDTYDYESGSQIDFNDPNFSIVTKNGRDMSNDPIIVVSWYGAAAYCNWRSGQEAYQACYNLSTWDCDFSKQGYRLPTEAEWEYAARGGFSGKRFPWADPNITHSQANYIAYPGYYPYDVSPTSGYHPDWDDGTYLYTSVVGSFSANGYGLYDMAGNVFEWCNDWYDGSYYDVSPYDNPTGNASGTNRILRGGSWSHYAGMCRAASRIGYNPVSCSETFGFRVVLVGVNSTRIGHWTMDDNSANTTVVDSSGNGNNGTAQQNTEDVSTTGVIERALTFDGSSDYVDLSGLGSTLDVQNISISLWAKPDSVTSTNWILGNGAQFRDTVNFWIREKDFGSTNQITGGSASVGDWHHIVGTYDGTYQKLYVNGSLVASEEPGLDVLDKGSDNFAIGKSNTHSSNYFDGDIDDVRIYGQAITPAEITSLYNLVP